MLPLTRSRNRARFFGIPFSPLSLFAAGEQGTWYDPSDFSTLFSDTSGTVPVTGIEDVVGYMLDKSGNGNHAIAPIGVGNARPTLRARYNLLTYSEEFDQGVWSKFGAPATSITANTIATTAPDGTNTADKLYEGNTTNTYHWVYQTAANSTALTLSCYVKAAEKNWCFLQLGSSVASGAYFDLQNGVLGSVSAGATANITSVGNGWYRCTVSRTTEAANSSAGILTATANNTNQYAGDGTSGIYIWGAQLLTAADAFATGNAYQRIAAATVYDTSNSVFRPYLAFGGTQAMSTGSIDFTATDKMTVWAGVTKLSDAAIGVVAELSATIASNNGTFLLSAPAGASPSYNFSSKGTTQANNIAQQFAAPITSIVTAQSDISDARNNIRVGGIDSGTNLATQGTGSFGNFALNIGARNNGASLPFTGRLYGNIIRGAQSTQAEVSATEAWLNARTGAPLVVQANQASFTWAGTSSPNSTEYLGTRYVTPVHEGMRRCLLLDNGTVNYYLDPNDSTKKADGTASVLTGADGQVMVEIPAFYTRRTVVGSATTWEVSATPASGFALHPAFTKDGVDVPFRYIGAYDACVYDDSAAAYISGLNYDNNISPNGVAVDSAADKLASVSGVYPMVGLTRAECRTIAANRGSGWRQLDYTLFSAVQLLYLIEYQSFYSENILGAGNTGTSYAASSGTQSDNGGSEAGKSNGIGNASTNTTNGASSASRGVAWMSYRGIENFYGNEWNWVDGVIVNAAGGVGANAAVWDYTNNSADFSDTVNTNMTQITTSGVTTFNYASAIASVDDFFIATSVSGGSSSTYTTDYFYGSASADRVVFVGGGASDGADAGAFDVSAADDASVRYRNVGARLAF